ncbi:MAG: metallophosphoesterase [Gammaproteobacteria bacterium]
MIRLDIPDALLERSFQNYNEYSIESARDFLAAEGFPISIGALHSRYQRRGWKIGDRPRPYSTWGPLDIDFLRRTYEDPAVPLRYIAEHLGKSMDTVRHKAHKLGLKRRGAESPLPRLVVPNISISRPLLVLADVHVPFQDGEWVARVSDLATAWGARQVLLAGDAIDGQELSRFERFDRPSTADEIDAWVQFEMQLLYNFDTVDWALGNHEARVGKMIDWKLPLGKAIEKFFVVDKERVRVHDTYAVTVNETLRVEHPKSTGATVAADLCSYHLQDVAVAHLHHHQVQYDRSGQFRAMHIGASADHLRMPYCTRITHGRYRMTQGALIVVPTEGPHGLTYFNVTPGDPIERMAGMYSAGEWADVTPAAA